MASNSELLMQLSATQIQAMTKKEMSVLLVSVIQLCGGMKKNFEILDRVNTKLGKLDKLDNIDGIKAGTDSIGKGVISLAKRVQELETAKNKMDDSDLSKKLEQLDRRLKDSINVIDRAQAYQQRFLEEMDAKSRRNNLIIMGVPEGNVESALGTSDLEKCLYIVQKTDISLHRDNLSIRRLGSDTSRTRPLLITLDCHETCREILNNAKKLKDVSDCANIFIRKDTHPTLRYEANRLRIRERNEKARPENRNVNIQYDRKERVLIRNGIIIDRFRPSFL